MLTRRSSIACSPARLRRALGAALDGCLALQRLGRLATQVRDSQPHIWHWRDWIVESLNADKAYDRMIVEMLAGRRTRAERSGRLAPPVFSCGTSSCSAARSGCRTRSSTPVQAFLGLTIGCARCHDHMYDPIPRRSTTRSGPSSSRTRCASIACPACSIRQKTSCRAGGSDAQPDAKTRLFVRGDDRNPTGDPLRPGVPESMGGSFDVKPVPLPFGGCTARSASGRSQGSV